jgi:transcriptional regulator with XRE-family HTH domain
LDVDVPLGRRIELARHRQGLSRQMLGDLIGRSAEWVRQAERGDRAVDRLSILLRLATVLKIEDLPGFLGCALPRSTAIRAGIAPVQDLCEALYALAPARRTGSASDPRPRVAAAWAAWQDSASPYAITLSGLPGLIRTLSLADDGQGAEPMAHALRLACAILRHLGELPAALLAARRAVFAARRSGCPLTEASCLGTYADTLIRVGSASQAMSICRQAAGLLANQAPGVVSDANAIAGRLALSAARAAAAAHVPDLARRWLARATQTAQRADGCADPRFPFDGADVEVDAVRIALRLGQVRQAVALARTVDVARVPARVRRCRGYVTVATVHARSHNPSAVLYALGKAEHACGEELRYNVEARGIIGDLLVQDNALIRTDVWALASRAGVA